MKTLIALLVFIILGIVQGFTEPLPISSSGHLQIIENLFGLNPDNLGISFDAFVNFGSTIAILIYFRKRIKTLFVDGITFLYAGFNTFRYRNNPENKNKFIRIRRKTDSSFIYILKVAVATIPLVLLVLMMAIIFSVSGIDKDNFEINIKLIGFSLLITAFALFLVSKKNGTKINEEVTFLDCFIIGCFQAIAIMPGISRSGMSLVGALFVGMKNEEAFDFVFMMYIPASVGALIFSITDLISDPYFFRLFIGYTLAAAMACIFTWLALKLLKKLVIAHHLQYFSVYCVIVGSLVILFLK